MRRRTWSAQVLRWGLVTFLYYATSAFVLNAFMQEWEFLTDHDHNGFTSMMSYTAERPWAYRLLMPVTVNAVAGLVPKSVLDRNERFLTSGSRVLGYMKVKSPPGWNAELGLRYHLLYYLVFLSLFATLWLTRYLAHLHLDHDGPVADIAPVAAFLVLPMTFLQGGYPYDFAELFFGVSVLICLEKRWLPLYYLVLPLAILNKEADVLLVLYFGVLMLGRMPFRRYALHLAAQLALGLALLFVVRRAFAGLEGAPAQFNLPGNLRFYSNPLWLVRLTDMYALGIPVPRAYNLLNLAMLSWAMLYHWREKPLGLRRLLVVMAACMLPIWFVAGYHDEVRNLSLVFPVIFVVALRSFASLYDELAPAPVAPALRDARAVPDHA